MSLGVGTPVAESTKCFMAHPSQGKGEPPRARRRSPRSSRQTLRIECVVASYPSGDLLRERIGFFRPILSEKPVTSFGIEVIEPRLLQQRAIRSQSLRERCPDELPANVGQNLLQSAPGMFPQQTLIEAQCNSRQIRLIHRIDREARHPIGGQLPRTGRGIEKKKVCTNF